MATILWSRGRNHAQLGHHREAAADMRRALAVGLENDRPAGEIGEYRFSLGEALWETGERAAALEEVEKARAAWQLSGLKTTKMDAWLKERQ
jgi:hypothetical protein